MSIQSKAVVCRELNAPVVVETITVQKPQAGEVLVEMKACGVCHSDLSATNGTIAFPLPLILGHEGAGIVVEVGEGVTELAPGDHVLTSFVSMCGRCRYCQTGRPQLCDQGAKTLVTLPGGALRTQDAAGKPLNIFSGCGSMSQYQTLHQDNLVKIDAEVPLDRAALIGCGVMTGFGAAANTARVEPGSRAVVFGAGGVGLSAIQGCVVCGASQVVAVDTSEAKLDFARQMGATHTIDASKEENVVKALRKITEGGVDYAFECVGHGEIAEQAYGSLSKGGTAIIVGVAPLAHKTSVRTASLTFEEKTLTGSYFGSARPRQDFPRLISLYKGGRLKLDELVTRTYSIDEAPQAFEDLAQGRNARGVIVF